MALLGQADYINENAGWAAAFGRCVIVLRIFVVVLVATGAADACILE
jgi:hypothetical protein